MGIGRKSQQGGGYQLQDCDYILGIAGGQNLECQDIIAKAGGGQALATPIGPNAFLVRIKTCVTNLDSAQLPQAIKGQAIMVYNSTAQTCNVYANPNTNKVTGVLDTINGAANANAITMAALVAAGTGYLFFCPADGIWAAMKSG